MCGETSRVSAQFIPLVVLPPQPPPPPFPPPHLTNGFQVGGIHLHGSTRLKQRKQSVLIGGGGGLTVITAPVPPFVGHEDVRVVGIRDSHVERVGHRTSAIPGGSEDASVQDAPTGTFLTQVTARFHHPIAEPCRSSAVVAVIGIVAVVIVAVVEPIAAMAMTTSVDGERRHHTIRMMMMMMICSKANQPIQHDETKSSFIS